MYYVGMSYTEAYTLPIAIRSWMLRRIQKELEAAKKTENVPTKALQHNDPQTRQMLGMQRSNPPAKLRRFT